GGPGVGRLVVRQRRGGDRCGGRYEQQQGTSAHDPLLGTPPGWGVAGLRFSPYGAQGRPLASQGGRAFRAPRDRLSFSGSQLVKGAAMKILLIALAFVGGN